MNDYVLRRISGPLLPNPFYSGLSVLRVHSSVYLMALVLPGSGVPVCERRVRPADALPYTANPAIGSFTPVRN
jgi:hypothetical protein